MVDGSEPGIVPNDTLVRGNMGRLFGILEHVGFAIAILALAIYFVRDFLKRRTGPR
jgi:hypothetical protein